MPDYNSLNNTKKKNNIKKYTLSNSHKPISPYLRRLGL